MLPPFANGCFLRSLGQLKIGIRQDGSRQKRGPQPRQVKSPNTLQLHIEPSSLPSDSYLPANWALRRQQREDIEEDEYVTVSIGRVQMSQLISGHKYGVHMGRGIGVDTGREVCDARANSSIQL